MKNNVLFEKIDLGVYSITIEYDKDDNNNLMITVYDELGEVIEALDVQDEDE